jgi:predicted tellurium resistance membrane protein TerC
MPELLTENLIALVALAAMEIVLGIDNVVFIAILSGRLPQAQQAAARQTGLLLAMGSRIALLFAITAVIALDDVHIFKLSNLGLFTDWLHKHEEIDAITWKDLILFVGGLFLIGKATFEIHEKMEGTHHGAKKPAVAGFASVVIQIALLDIVFSIDSVITAVGMVPNAETNPYAMYVMITAIVIAVGVMLVFAGRVSAFIEKHPTLKMLALAFLILIGVMLVAESIGTEIEKGYIYFAMGFALFVEFLNLRVRLLRQPKPAAEGTPPS